MKATLLLTGSITLAAALAGATTFEVDATTDCIPGSLHSAITAANATPAPDVIRFNIGSGGAETISPLTPLPALTAPVLIDGWTQPGSVQNPIIRIDGLSAGDGNGPVISAHSCTVLGLVITRFLRSGIEIQTGSGNYLYGNFIGLVPPGVGFPFVASPGNA